MRFLRAWAYLTVTALLVACNNNLVTLSGLPQPTASGPPSKTFSYTGKPQTFRVPAGVSQLNVTVEGAGGGGGTKGIGPPGARGAKITATISVKPGQILTIYVGGHGKLGGNGSAEGGGFNGGGNAVASAFGGGGSSDVRTGPTLSDRILVAAGGGGTGETLQVFPGTGSYYWCYGGGGGLGGAKGGGFGTYGYCNGGNGGRGGSIRAGGAGGAGGAQGSGSGGQPCNGAPGKSGALGRAGDGGTRCSGSGGGAGGGYYGGGGGGSGGCCNAQGGGGAGGGGGGGSSYVEPTATNIQRSTGLGSPSDGLVSFTWFKHAP